MARDDAFAFRVSDEERRMIEKIAENLQRTQSDAVRLLIRGAARELEAKSGQPSKGGKHAQQ